MNLLTRCLLTGVSLTGVSLATLPLPAAATPAFGESSYSLVAYGDYAYLVSSSANSPINVRDDASTRAYARHIGYAGDRVEVLERSIGEDGYMWYFVRFTVSNATGWVRGDFISIDRDDY
ncbi:MAG: SH3 domain-containing protein [Pegethrix bostrychoides GSE-TBD4-15B]|jgi:hypothetical protein|uniref:SH3 domain-containing protein n=1 Tax=Pegethrix bostrychoides GSE-TBD4-15B TaxID=2839662 RepID=A0A951PAU0_9CYAN|nr:SH3 domain-containing protein [Pegethrix bostrychoides GSE-TBD4-15B]